MVECSLMTGGTRRRIVLINDLYEYDVRRSKVRESTEQNEQAGLGLARPARPDQDHTEFFALPTPFWLHADSHLCVVDHGVECCFLSVSGCQQ